MAKGNLLQGMGRGKLGDVVFSRLNGQQVSRVRNRNPKNPRSNAQLYQRAIMATIMQAYSAGKQIFDHSFQGVSVGAGCQAVFMRKNLKSLRTKLSHEINDGVLADDLTVHCVYPGSTSPVPNEYLISMGTYDQKAFTPEVLSSGVAFTLPAPENNETVAAFCARVGLIPDDYYTFCFFLSGEDMLYEAPTANDNSLGQVFDCQFGFARLHVRSNVKSIESPVADWIDVFEIDETANCAPTFIYGSITFGISLEALDYQQNGAGALGCIRSRKDKDLRSTSYMFCPPSGEVGINEFGLCANYVLESWKAGTQSLGNSDLILEGGGGAKPAPAPVTSNMISGYEIYNDPNSELYSYQIGYNNSQKVPISLYDDGNDSVGIVFACKAVNDNRVMAKQYSVDDAGVQTIEELITSFESGVGLTTEIISNGTTSREALINIQLLVPNSDTENILYRIQKGTSTYLGYVNNGIGNASAWPNGSVERAGMKRLQYQYIGNNTVEDGVVIGSDTTVQVTDESNYTITLGSNSLTVSNGSIQGNVTPLLWFV